MNDKGLMPCKAGDRIRLIDMPQDPDPIPPGTTGTVRSVVMWNRNEGQIMVDWDIPRSLSLCTGIDKFEVIHETP